MNTAHWPAELAGGMRALHETQLVKAPRLRECKHWIFLLKRRILRELDIIGKAAKNASEKTI